MYCMYPVMLKIARNIYHLRKISMQMVKTRQHNK